MHKHTHNLVGSDEKALIFGLVLLPVSVLGTVLNLILGFGSDFGSLFGLLFGFGVLFGTISLILLSERHRQAPFQECDQDLSIIPADFA